MQRGLTAEDFEVIRRKFAGNIALCQYLNRNRFPCFLRRNIRAFLFYYKAKAPLTSRMAPPSPSASRNNITRVWDPKEILQIIDEKKFSDTNPFFRFDIRAIRDVRKSFKSSTPNSTPERPSKQSKLEGTRALCTLNIWEGQGISPLLFSETISCLIRAIPRPDSGERYARVELDRPFRVYCQDLVPQSGRPLTAQRYSMQIAMQAESLDTTWPPLDLNKVPTPESPIFTDSDGTRVRHPLLVTNYSRFPQCPAKDDEALLGLTVTQDGRQYKPKLSLQIEAKWLEPSKPNESYESWLKYKRSNPNRSPAMARKVATTTTDPEPPTPGLKIKTVWEIQHRKIKVTHHTFEGLICPLCNDKDFTNPNYYFVHLVNDHDVFKFRPTIRYREEDPLCGYLKVKVDIKDTYETGRDGSKAGEGENFSRKPGSVGIKESLALRTFGSFFDLQDYLQKDVDKNWKPPKGHERQGRLLNANSSRSRSDSAFDSSARATPSAVVELTRPAHMVPDLPPPRRRKHKVPAAPDGVQFYSLLSKRRLEEGELLSESDDDIDQGWFLAKQQSRINSFEDLTPEEKSFIRRHDRHILREQVNSNLHYREALIRFCRINSQWLKRADVRREFAKNLAALQNEGVIKTQQIFECMNIIDRPGAGDSMDVDWERESLAREAASSPTATTRRYYSKCEVCSDPIRSLEDIARCSNPSCFSDCHLSCYADMFGTTGAGDNEDPTECFQCRAADESRAAGKDQLGLRGADPHSRTNGPNNRGEVARTRDQASGGRRDHVVGDALAIERTGSDQGSLDMLDKFAPDDLSRLPNGKRATTPKRHPESFSPHTNLQAGGTFARPITIDDGEEDFPVGRDRSRIRQSQMQQNHAPDSLTYGHDPFSGRYVASDPTHRHVSADAVPYLDAALDRVPKARRPHEL